MLPSTGATHVADLVRALALGWKNLAAYPPGHPTLIKSLAGVHQALTSLRGPAGEVVLGISNDGLLFGDEKIDSMTAQKFAQALYARGVAVLRFDNQTKAQDIETFLRLLAAGTPAEMKRPIWEELTAAGVMHINLQPVDYSSVQVTDDLQAPPQKEPSLWDEILRALMEGRELSAEAEVLAEEPESADDLTKMILKYVDHAVNAKPKFDPNATFGVRVLARPETPDTIHQRVAEAVARTVAEAAAGPKKQSMLQQALELLRALPEPMRGTVLRNLVARLATDENSGPMLRQLVSELPHDEVLEALRYLSSMGNLSGHALNLLQSLAALRPSSRAEPPSADVIGDLVRLFAEDDVDRFNPPDHAALLENVSIRPPQASPEPTSTIDALGKRVETVTDEALSRQVTRTILDLLASIGATRPPAPLLERIEGSFRVYLKSANFEDALELVTRFQEVATDTDSDELRHAIHEAIGRMAGGETIKALVQSIYVSPPEKARTIQRLIEVLGAGARRNLLAALAEESNRSRRRRMFDFIASLGPVIVPEVIGWLSDSRWFVLRNMIALLRAVNDRTSLPEIRKLAQHKDLRVRMEAIKTLFTLDTGVPVELLENLIRDPDPKVSETAVTLIGSSGIREGLQPLLHLLEGNDIFGSKRSLRVKAIKALGELADPAALPVLTRFLRDPFLPWPSPEERLAAWQSLSGYPAEARAELLPIGQRSRHPQVREICARMEQS